MADPSSSIPAMVTEEFVKTVIERDTGQAGIKVEDFTCERGTDGGENFATLIFRLAVRFGCEGQEVQTRSFLCKFPPVQPGHLEITRATQSFDREMYFYNHIVPLMSKNDRILPDVPKCVLAEPSAIIMRDLKAEGFKLPNKFRGLQSHELDVVMRTYARFHALGLKVVTEDAEVSSQELLKHFAFGNVPGFSDFVRQSLRNLVWLLPEDLGRKVEKYIGAHGGGPERFEEVFRRPGKLTGLTHLDSWCYNMLFKYEDERATEMRILDLQLLSLGNPIRDLVNIFYCSVDSTVRVTMEKHLKSYHETLLASTKELDLSLDYPYPTFYQDFLSLREFGFLQAAMVVPIFLSQDIPDMEKEDLTMERFGDVHGASIDSEDLVKQRLLDVVREMVKGGVI
ncbi:unnamed protein product [Darwinula stevensoni]|uniref:CHK kinase-like domain-containing protein n=1 Tax=Darwinula stevensoni TaxID=69355 RepID=A0A7R8XKF0_9CRUS|nr:unnamed protein product [Darwinula stevensoni]CAG0895144.1 unnamed protein product [Darwinula stevensoni]